MKKNVLVIRFIKTAALALAASTFGCWDHNPCDDGYIFVQDQCMLAPTPAPSSDAGAGEAAVSEAGSASSFGKTCSAATDCASDAPICAAPQLPYCTQINCNPGEANAGACPAGFACMQPPGAPSSVCLKQ